LKLKAKGFKVEFEYPFRNRRVDVVGFKNNTKIAVEIGHTPPEKLEFLSKHFDEVYVISYRDALLNFDEILSSFMEEIEKLKKELEMYKGIVIEAYIRALYKMIGKIEENEG